LIFDLTGEISELIKSKHYNVFLNSTIDLCRELIGGDHYTAIIGEYQKNKLQFMQAKAIFLSYKLSKLFVESASKEVMDNKFN
jgi:hypothetical protein